MTPEQLENRTKDILEIIKGLLDRLDKTGMDLITNVIDHRVDDARLEHAISYLDGARNLCIAIIRDKIIPARDRLGEQHSNQLNAEHHRLVQEEVTA